MHAYTYIHTYTFIHTYIYIHMCFEESEVDEVRLWNSGTGILHDVVVPSRTCILYIAIFASQPEEALAKVLVGC